MTKEIPLTRGKVALVDDEDYERLSQFKWHANRSGNTWYAVRKSEGGKVLIHRVILDAPSDLQVDHINMDGLDNRRSNLRLSTHSQNNHNRIKYSRNTSGFKGVFWHKRDLKWQASIRANGHLFHIGYFDSREDAAHAYDSRAIELHGEFSRTNF